MRRLRLEENSRRNSVHMQHEIATAFDFAVYPFVLSVGAAAVEG
jgi:hypothetical protein